MSAAPELRTPEPGRRLAALLWFGVLGGPAAWAAQLVIGYGIQEVTCSSGTRSDSLWGLGVESALWILTGLAAATALAAGVAALRVLRSTEGLGGRGEPRGRIGFMGYVGILASALFLLLIVVGGLALIFVDSCVAG
jgi:hypothetical protein